MKKELNGQHFATDNDVIDAVEMYSEDQDSSFYEEGIRKLHDRWNKCVNLQVTMLKNKRISFTWKLFLRFRP